MNPETAPLPNFPSIDVDELPAEQAILSLVDHAAGVGASDLFLYANREGIHAMVRHLGIVRPIAHLKPEFGRRMVGTVLANAGMNAAERRHPQDGRWVYRKPNGHVVDLRINSIPTMQGEDLAIRLLVRDAGLLDMTKLGMTKGQLQTYESAIQTPGGLVLITGPTGSGKTATMYSALVRLNDGTKKINTIEDPVEFTIDGLRQSQVNPTIDLTFLELLRSVLRQSPDVIMLGEIRDEDTAKIAVHAANSGILVLATLHASNAAGAVQSMRSFGINPHFFASSLRMAISQRLVRTLDPDHKMEFDMEVGELFEDIQHLLAPGAGHKLYGPQPHMSNQMTGYTGRTGVFEIMPVSREIRNLIAAEEPTAKIYDQAVDDGMVTFRQAALLKVANGETTSEEVFRVIPSEQLVIDG